VEELGVAFGGRARRALAVMGLAVVGLSLAVGVSLRAGGGRQPAPPGPAVLSSLDWLSATTGWAVLTDSRSHASVLFRTTDAGRRWERQLATPGDPFSVTTPTGVSGAVTVRFLDARHGLLSRQQYPGDNPTILRTGDGGAHWSPIRLPGLGGLRRALPFFLDPDHGWALLVDDPGTAVQPVTLYRTVDGGRDWALVTGAGPGLPAEGMKAWIWFRTRLDGWVGSLERDGSASVAVTHDGGGSWRAAALPEPAGGWNAGHALALTPPSVAADGRGALVVVDSNRLSATLGGRSPRAAIAEPVAVYASRDGGDTWADPRPGPAGTDPRLSDAVFVGGSNGWLAGGDAAWVSSDAGRTWLRRDRLAAGWSFASLTPLDGAVAAAEVISGSPLTLGGPTWRLLVTEDAGGSWRDVPSPRL
jgi:photosystem II stability/assembly factor-like uncharacterized protein